MTTGIDIGGTSVKVAHAGTTATSDRYTDPDPAQLRAAIRQALNRAGVTRVDRACLCLPGIVERGVLTRAVNLPALEGTPIASLLLEEADIRVETDVRAAAHHIWHERGVRGRLLVIAIGTGVGACVLDDGRPLHVTGTTPGHLGHIDVGGCMLEEAVGLEGLRAANEDVDGEAIQLSPNTAPFQALARAIRTAHAIYRPHHITLAGGIGIRLGPTIRHLRDRHLTPLARADWTLETGTTPYHGALGAALLADDFGTLHPPRS